MTFASQPRYICEFDSFTITHHRTRDSPRTFNDPRANCSLFFSRSKLAIARSDLRNPIYLTRSTIYMFIHYSKNISIFYNIGSNEYIQVPFLHTCWFCSTIYNFILSYLTIKLCTSRLKSTKRRRSLRACYYNFKLDCRPFSISPIHEILRQR